MDTLLSVLAVLFGVVGCVGCIVPVLPGVALAYAGYSFAVALYPNVFLKTYFPNSILNPEASINIIELLITSK
ncbi:MAG: hypothetical protein IKA49_03055, partial [Alistipes sp.]|nr:hypothetical protein [Alistipes sp.]